MDNSVFFNLDYDNYTLEVIVDNFLDKVVEFAYYKELKEYSASIKDTLKPIILNELEDLFEGKGLNTKTKKSDLYNILENKLNLIFKLLDTPMRELLFIESSIKKVNGTNNTDQKDIQRYELLGLNKASITGAIKLKLFARYQRLLPKKRTIQFKDEYPILNSCYGMYEGYQANKEADEKYIKVHNNGGISDVIQNLHLCKNNIVQNEYKNVEIKLTTPKGNLIDIDLNKDNEEALSIVDVLQQLNNLVGANQSQLIVYIISLAFKQSTDINKKPSSNVIINIQDYCKLKNIDYRSDTADNIYKNIDNLRKILISYDYKDEKGNEKFIKNSPIITNRGIDGDKTNNEYNSKELKVNIGAWIDTLNYSQFQFISKAFFKYKLRNNNQAIIPISYYLNCQHRNNLKINKIGIDNFKVKVSRLTTKLGIDEDRVKSKGYSSTLKKPLEKILNDIKEAEGFNWSYKNGTHNSRAEFEDDVINFNNNTLNNLYIKKGYKKR